MLIAYCVTSDIYDVVPNSELMPPIINEAASYDSAGTYQALDEDGNPRECDVNDIADFIVEYINSDVLVCFLSRQKSLSICLTFR